MNRSFETDNNRGLGVTDPDRSFQSGMRELLHGKARPHWQYKIKSELSINIKSVADNQKDRIPSDATDITFIPEGEIIYESYDNNVQVHRHDNPDAWSASVPYCWEQKTEVT